MKKQPMRPSRNSPPPPSAPHVVSRAHLAHIGGAAQVALFERVANGDVDALALVPLVLSAASAVGHQRVIMALRERTGLPGHEAHALTLDMMARSGNVDETAVKRFIEANYPQPEIQTALACVMSVRKSSFLRAGQPLDPAVASAIVLDVDTASRAELILLARLLQLVDDPSDFSALLDGLRGSAAKRTLLLEHTCSILLLQADLKLFAPDRGRSESLARRLLRLLATKAIPGINSIQVLLQAGFSFVFAGRAQDALRMVDALHVARHEPAITGLHAHIVAQLGDMPSAIGLLDEHVRRVFAKPPTAEGKSAGVFNAELAAAILRDVNGVLRRAGLKPFIMSGTLLGYVREGGIMKHDKDFDIGIIGWDTQYTAAEALLRSKRYRIDPTRLTGHDLFCMPVMHVASNMCFDMFIYHDKGDHFLHGIDFLAGFTLHFQWSKFDLQEVQFLGDSFYAPADIDRNMAENYGLGWREPDPGYHVKLESPAIARRASHVVNFLAHLEFASAVQKRRDPAYLNRLADICEHTLTPGFRPADDLIAKLRTLKWT
jgi:hypothetical protein